MPLTLTLGWKGGGGSEDVGDSLVGEPGLDLVCGRANAVPALKSTLAVTCAERSTRRASSGLAYSLFAEGRPFVTHVED